MSGQDGMIMIGSDEIIIPLEEFEFIFNVKKISDKLIELYDLIKDIYTYEILDTEITKEDIIIHLTTVHNFFLNATPEANRHNRTLGIEQMVNMAIIIVLFNIPVENENIVNPNDEIFIQHILSLYKQYISEQIYENLAIRSKKKKTANICTISNKYLKYKQKYLKLKNQLNKK
jgi:hypothetical protein